MKEYIKIARLDHWFKQIFMLPGIVFAIFYTKNYTNIDWITLVVGVFCVCFIASANYVINEWLDAEFDKFHPLKKNRPSVLGGIKLQGVIIEYIILAALGLGIGYTINFPFFLTLLVLLIMGAFYNIQPIRTKDRPYLDVISESVNNPLRLLLGWFLIVDNVIPPGSLLLAYWGGGAFLMGIKRFAELRFIDDKTTASLYRKSFAYYTVDRLLVSTVIYALVSAFFLGIFLVKYRIEYVVCFPFIAIIFGYYLKIGLKENSVVQRPEKLYQEKNLFFLISFVTILFLVLTFVDLSFLRDMVNKDFIEI